MLCWVLSWKYFSFPGEFLTSRSSLRCSLNFVFGLGKENLEFHLHSWSDWVLANKFMNFIYLFFFKCAISHKSLKVKVLLYVVDVVMFVYQVHPFNFDASFANVDSFVTLCRDVRSAESTFYSGDLIFYLNLYLKYILLLLSNLNNTRIWWKFIFGRHRLVYQLLTEMFLLRFSQ